MKYRVYIDTFSGSAADLKRGQRTRENVLAVLERDPMVSTWDMSEHAWLRNTIADLERDGLIAEQNQPYPWLRYALTDAGRALLRPNVPHEGPSGASREGHLDAVVGGLRDGADLDAE